MKRRKLATLVVTTAAIAMVLFITEKPLTQADEATSQNRKVDAITFVEKVAGVNLSNYATGVSVLDGTSGEWEVQFRLVCKEGNITIIVWFERNKINWVYFEPKPPPSWLWTNPLSNNVHAARETLEQYDLYFDNSLTQFVQALDRAVPNQNQTISDGNLTLRISENGRCFQWSIVVNGVEAFNPVYIELTQDGHLMYFSNWWDIIKIADVQSVISEAQAKNIALTYANEYAEKNGRTVSSVTAQLRYDRAADRYTLYPMWYASVNFDELEGAPRVLGYEVLMYADTGSVITQQPVIVASGARITDPNYTLAFLVVGSLAVVPIVSILAYRKRKTQNRRERE